MQRGRHPGHPIPDVRLREFPLFQIYCTGHRLYGGIDRAFRLRGALLRFPFS